MKVREETNFMIFHMMTKCYMVTEQFKMADLILMVLGMNLSVRNTKRLRHSSMKAPRPKQRKTDF